MGVSQNHLILEDFPWNFKHLFFGLLPWNFGSPWLPRSPCGAPHRQWVPFLLGDRGHPTVGFSHTFWWKNDHDRSLFSSSLGIMVNLRGKYEGNHPLRKISGEWNMIIYPELYELILPVGKQSHHLRFFFWEAQEFRQKCHQFFHWGQLGWMAVARARAKFLGTSGFFSELLGIFNQFYIPTWLFIILNWMFIYIYIPILKNRLDYNWVDHMNHWLFSLATFMTVHCIPGKSLFQLFTATTLISVAGATPQIRKMQSIGIVQKRLERMALSSRFFMVLF